MTKDLKRGRSTGKETARSYEGENFLKFEEKNWDEQLQGDHTSKMQETQWASGNSRRSEKDS